MNEFYEEFIDLRDSSQCLRIFKKLPAGESTWHRDAQDRIVTVRKNSGGWKIQYDNELPEVLKVGKQYKIVKNQWHRVIQGEGALEIWIQKK